MDGIVVEVSLGDTIGRNGSGQSRDLGFLVTPTATTLARGIGISYNGQGENMRLGLVFDQCELSAIQRGSWNIARA